MENIFKKCDQLEKVQMQWEYYKSMNRMNEKFVSTRHVYYVRNKTLFQGLADIFKNDKNKIKENIRQRLIQLQNT